MVISVNPLDLIKFLVLAEDSLSAEGILVDTATYSVVIPVAVTMVTRLVLFDDSAKCDERAKGNLHEISCAKCRI